MRRLENIAFLGGLVMAAVYTALLFIFMPSWESSAATAIDHTPGYIVYIVYFMLAFASPLVISADIRKMEACATMRPSKLHYWDNHYGHRLTLFVVRRPILFYAMLAIPMFYFLVRITVGGCYHFVELVIEPIADGFRNAFEWIKDRVGWY